MLWDNGEPIGYGLIREEEGKSWVTGALVEDERGNGKGQFLFCELSERCEGTPYLEVWEDNLPAVSLYTKLGYVVVSMTVGQQRTLLTMRMV